MFAEGRTSSWVQRLALFLGHLTTWYFWELAWLPETLRHTIVSRSSFLRCRTASERVVFYFHARRHCTSPAVESDDDDLRELAVDDLTLTNFPCGRGTDVASPERR